MPNMLSVIQNHKTNLLKDTNTPTVQEFRTLFTSWKMLIRMVGVQSTGWLVGYKPNQKSLWYLQKKLQRAVHTASFRNKSEEKVQNSQSISGSWKIAT